LETLAKTLRASVCDDQLNPPRLSGGGQLLFDQVLANGIESKFQPVGDPQLVDDIVQTGLDREFRDEQFFPDLFVPVTLRHQLDDHCFAIAEQQLIPAWPILRTLSESFNGNILLACSVTTPQPTKSCGNSSNATSRGIQWVAREPALRGGTR